MNTTASSPLISVVIPVYNRARSLRQSLDSVLGQEFGSYELIVVDDGSSDDINTLREQYAPRGVIFLRNEVNLGVGPTRNKGVRGSRGEWVAFLDSDSYLVPGGLSALSETIGTCDDKVGVVYGKSEQLDGTHRPYRKSREAPTRWGYKEFVSASYIAEALPVTRRDILLRFPFEEHLGIKRECGSLVWLAIGRAGYDFVWTRELVQRYELSPDGLSGRKFLAAHPDEMVICNQRILECFGDDILQYNRQKLISLQQKTAFYCIMAARRHCASRHARLAWDLDRFNLRSLFLLVLCRMSPRTARTLYPVIASVGA